MAAHIFMPWIHRVFSNLKRWGGAGVFHDFMVKYLNTYLGEYVFRWNRRRHQTGDLRRHQGDGGIAGKCSKVQRWHSFAQSRMPKLPARAPSAIKIDCRSSIELTTSASSGFGP
jgi:hypothetical protein